MWPTASDCTPWFYMGNGIGKTRLSACECPYRTKYAKVQGLLNNPGSSGYRVESRKPYQLVNLITLRGCPELSTFSTYEITSHNFSTPSPPQLMRSTSFAEASFS